VNTILSVLLLSTTFTFAAAQVASPMKITPFQTEDVKLVAYPSSEFSNDLSVFLGKHSLDLDDPLIAEVLPYAVFVENRSNHSLFGVTARYDFETPAGAQAHFSFFRINQNPGNPEQNLAANQISLFTPIPQLDTLIRDFGGSGNWPPEAKTDIEKEAASFVRHRNIAFSIDSVIDDKGFIVGPDREATLLRVNTTNDAEQDLIKKTQASLAMLGIQPAVAELKMVAKSDRDEGTVDPKRGVNKQLLFYRSAQIRLARSILSASGSGVDLTDMLNSLAAKNRLHVSRKVEDE
jgi:hypothetical protein